MPQSQVARQESWHEARGAVLVGGAGEVAEGPLNPLDADGEAVEPSVGFLLGGYQLGDRFRQLVNPFCKLIEPPRQLVNPFRQLIEPSASVGQPFPSVGQPFPSVDRASAPAGQPFPPAGRPFQTAGRLFPAAGAVRGSGCGRELVRGVPGSWSRLSHELVDIGAGHRGGSRLVGDAACDGGSVALGCVASEGANVIPGSPMVSSAVRKHPPAADFSG